MNSRSPSAAVFVLLAVFWRPLPAAADIADALMEAGLAPAGEATVVSVEEGGVLHLDDGSSAVLAGIELPRRPPAAADAPWPAAEAARAALAGLAEGQTLRLYAGEVEEDRYGRRLVQAVAADGGWLQGALLAQGWARVATTPDSRQAARLMLAAEAPARRARLGLWGLSAYGLRRPGETPGLVGSRQVVEGRVSGVHRARSGLYISLGDRGGRLTVHLSPAILRQADDDDAGDFRDLRGGWLRVRGWIGETDDGPLIEVSHPEQIERVEDAAPWRRSYRGQRNEG